MIWGSPAIDVEGVGFTIMVELMEGRFNGMGHVGEAVVFFEAMSIICHRAEDTTYTFEAFVIEIAVRDGTGMNEVPDIMI